MEEAEAVITVTMTPTTGSSEVFGTGLGSWGPHQAEAFVALRVWCSCFALSFCSCSL